MELPSILSNREAYRRSLQNNLRDVLGDVTSLDSQQMGHASLRGPTAAQQQQNHQQQQFQPNGGGAASSLLRSPQSSLLAQSLGGSPSQFTQSAGLGSPSAFPRGGPPQTAEDYLLAKATENRLITQAAKAAFLQQTIAAQQNKTLNDAYVALLRDKAHGKMMAVGAAPSGGVGQMASNIPHSMLYASLGATTALQNQQAAAMMSPNQHHQQFIAGNNSSQALGVGGLVGGGAAGPTENKKQKIAQTLKALGTNLRSRYDPFIDCLDIEDPEEETSRRSRGGVSEHFPERLFRMLEDVEKEGKTDIVSFYSHGRAFGVHDMERFIEEVMPKYFKQSKWNSFARQLNLYGFMRLASGPDSGGYYHELFLKSRPTLCRYMRRVGVPQGQQDRRKCRPKNVVDIQEPDFYAMKPAR